jgi:hypothetical protein
MCSVGTDCNSGCCATLEIGGQVCGPSTLCQAAAPCATFEDCVINNPQPSFETNGGCATSDSDAATVVACTMSVGASCPGGDCTQCTRGSTYCTDWDPAQAECDSYFASIGGYDSSDASNLRATHAMFCPP